MPGGLVFTVDAVPIMSPDGDLIHCPACGSSQFDVSLRGGELDRIECTRATCGRPLTADDYPGISEAGR